LIGSFSNEFDLDGLLLYASFLVEQDHNDFLDKIDAVAVVEEAVVLTRPTTKIWL
jgi:hypothetical protein